MCEPSVALECGSDQPRARLTAGPDVREHPCQPRWASFLKVSCGKTAVKTRAFRSEIISGQFARRSFCLRSAHHAHKNYFSFTCILVLCERADLVPSVVCNVC